MLRCSITTSSYGWQSRLCGSSTGKTLSSRRTSAASSTSSTATVSRFSFLFLGRLPLCVCIHIVCFCLGFNIGEPGHDCPGRQCGCAGQICLPHHHHRYGRCTFRQWVLSFHDHSCCFMILVRCEARQQSDGGGDLRTDSANHKNQEHG